MAIASDTVDGIASGEVEEIAGDAVGCGMWVDRKIGLRLIAGIQREIAIAVAFLFAEGA